MCFQVRRSNNPIMEIESATHPKPARKPAVAPHGVVVFGSFKNMARLIAIASEKTSDRPNIFAALPRFRSSSVKPQALIHAFPKNIREYHNPPKTNIDNAAATMASQFKFARGISTPLFKKSKSGFFTQFYLRRYLSDSTGLSLPSWKT